MYVSEDEALAAALEQSECAETQVFHFEDEPSWWDESVDGPFEPFYAIGCQSTGIVFPDYRLALPWLLDNYWPDEWGPVPPI